MTNTEKTTQEKDYSAEAAEYQLLQDTKNLRNAKSTLYVPKKDRYEDAHSSALIFGFFGLLGDAIAVLSFFEIIHLPIAANKFSQVSMFLMFTAFLVIGIVSYKKAKALEVQISEEDNANSVIKDWLEQNITETRLEQVVDSTAADEVNYLHKLEYIKNELSTEFPQYDEEFIELLSDEFLTKLYDEK